MPFPSEYSHAAPFKMYSNGFRAFFTCYSNCIRFVSVRSSLPCINIDVRIDLTIPFSGCLSHQVDRGGWPRSAILPQSLRGYERWITIDDVSNSPLRLCFWVYAFSWCPNEVLLIIKNVDKNNLALIVKKGETRTWLNWRRLIVFPLVLGFPRTASAPLGPFRLYSAPRHRWSHFYVLTLFWPRKVYSLLMFDFPPFYSLVQSSLY